MDIDEDTEEMDVNFPPSPPSPTSPTSPPPTSPPSSPTPDQIQRQVHAPGPTGRFLYLRQREGDDEVVVGSLGVQAGMNHVATA